MKTVRRFLLAPSLARLITKERGVDRQIVEGYLSVKPGNNQYVRLQADECHLILPLLGSTGEVTEHMAPLPRLHAEMLFNISIGQISYDQVYLPIPGTVSSEALLDRIIYPNSCDILTVEFDNQQQAEAFDVPVWLGPEVTAEYTHDRRYIALNGVPSNPEVALSNLQLQALLDMLEQTRRTEGNSNNAAHEVIVALSRSLETSGVLKGRNEVSPPSGMGRDAEQVREPIARLIQQT